MTQVEYYFGDKNLPNDRFLNEVRSKNPQGCKFSFIDFFVIMNDIWFIFFFFFLFCCTTMFIHLFVFNFLNRDSIENDLQVQENADLQRL